MDIRLDVPFHRAWVCYGCRIKERCEIRDSGCWLWRGAMRGNYGVIRIREAKDTYAIRNVHRAAYAVWKGKVPVGVSVLHTCPHKRCCNPDHLYPKVQPLQLNATELAFDSI